jgi:hypothetical protein
LSGFVNTNEQKRNAEQIAQSIPGVNRVVNEITIVPQTATPTSRGGANDNNAQFNQGQATQSPTNAPGSYRQ